MEEVFGLLVMLLGVCHGVETYCDGRQDGAQCYGALGGTVVLQLMNNTSEITRYQWTKETTVILTGRKNTIVLNLIETRSVFTPSDGTFRLSNLSRNDGDKYTLEMFDQNGQKAAERTLQLSIQAPVSSVQLDSGCLSQGEMWVSCSSEGGDSPQYSWTLDGRMLTDAELLPSSGSNEANIITLKQHVSGRLVCFVKNHVSSVSKGQSISTCGDHSLLICGLQSAVAILSFGGIAVYFNWKKTKHKKAEASATPQTTEKSENCCSVTELRSLSDRSLFLDASSQYNDSSAAQL